MKADDQKSMICWGPTMVQKILLKGKSKNFSLIPNIVTNLIIL